MTVNDRIFLTLQQQKKKQNDLAEFLGIKHVAVSNWKTGKSVPNIENLEKIAKFLNVSLDFLITGKEYNSICANNNSAIGNFNNNSNNNFFANETEKLNKNIESIELTEYQQELLKVVNSLPYKKKNILLSYAYQLQEQD